MLLRDIGGDDDKYAKFRKTRLVRYLQIFTALCLAFVVFLLFTGQLTNVPAEHSASPTEIHESETIQQLMKSAPKNFPFEIYRGNMYSVSYDARAFVFNGNRHLLHVGSIHYSRSSVFMWKGLMKKAKLAGINTIDTTIFWNYHEQVKGVYDFHSDNRDFVRFIKMAGRAGLFVIVRLGPFANGDWKLGGIPSWLLDGGNDFRTVNHAWTYHARNWLDVVFRKLQPQLAKNGGPIIAFQIENDYGLISGAYPESESRKYIEWCSKMAIELESNLPWMMSNQPDAPLPMIETYNGYYGASWLPELKSRQKPHPQVWTENYAGSVQSWGEPLPFRPVEDIAYSILQWISRGATFHNYYLWHGGTNFGRWAGAPYVTTSYDYGVAIDEFGFRNEPKYTHLKKLHHVVNVYVETLLSNEVPTPQQLNSDCFALIWGEFGETGSVAFLENNALMSQEVEFSSDHWTLPAWSVTVVDGMSMEIIFNTAELSHIAQMDRKESYFPVDKSSILWSYEPIGGSTRGEVQFADEPLAHLSVTRDQTDYLWYSTEVALETTSTTSHSLMISEYWQWLMIFVDKKLVATTPGRAPGDLKVEFDLQDTKKEIVIDILNIQMGLPSHGAHLEQVYSNSRFDDITLDGQSIYSSNWSHKARLEGEILQFWAYKETWDVDLHPNCEEKVGAELIWFWFAVSVPNFEAGGDDVGYGLDLRAMGKGQAWVNGRHIGRFWDIKSDYYAEHCELCDYRGKYQPWKCRKRCGDYSQSLYHIPKDWMALDGQNQIVVLTETGGNPENVKIVELKIQSM